MRRTKIIATYGPSLEDPKILTKVLETVDVIRINLAHGSWDEGSDQNNEKKIKLIRKLSKKIKKPIAILVDLKGNKIRIGDVKDHALNLEKSSILTIRFTTDKVSKKENEVVINAEHCFEKISLEDIILMDDGLIKLRVDDISETEKTLKCEVIEGGFLRSNKGFEVEGKIINQTGLGDADKNDIRRLAKLRVDWIALSFVNEASDINQAREVLSESASSIHLIAKIERMVALKQLYWIQ